MPLKELEIGDRALSNLKPDFPDGHHFIVVPGCAVVRALQLHLHIYSFLPLPCSYLQAAQSARAALPRRTGKAHRSSLSGGLARTI